jgi:hypothetical protein
MRARPSCPAGIGRRDTPVQPRTRKTVTHIIQHFRLTAKQMH